MLSIVNLERPRWWLLASLLTASLSMNFLDIAVAASSQSLPEPVFQVAELVSAVSDPVLVLAVLGIIAALSSVIQFLSERCAWLVSVKGLARPARWLLVAAALATILSVVLKFGLGRLRPGYGVELDHLVFRPLAFQEGFSSLPSTHCAIAGAVTIGLSALWPAIRTPMLQVGFFVCLSRALLGEHWASDTVLGWVLGAAVALMVHAVACKRPIPANDG